MISVLLIPSISRSGVTTTRCCKTGIAACLISSGVTKSRAFNAAKPLAAFKIAIEARGEAPKYKKAFSRVFITILAMYSTKFGSMMICFTSFWNSIMLL